MKKIFIIIMIFFCIITFMFSDEDHYINIFIGDRAAGLGGAYTAIADGPEGAYYNPAGLAFSSAKYFSLSANAINYKQLTYRDIWKSAETQIDYNRYSISFIPNFFGFLQKQKNFTFAVTICSPDSEFYDQRDKIDFPFDATGDMQANINLNLIDMLYEAGTSFAFLPHKRISVGFGVYITYRDKKLIYSQTYKIENYEYFATSNKYFSERNIGLKLQVGAQFMPVDFLSIGYSVSFPINIIGIYNRQFTSFTYYDDEYEDAVEALTSDNFPSYNFDDNIYIQDNKITQKNIFQDGFYKPTVIKQAIGLAFFITKSILVSIDGYLYVPITNKEDYGDLIFVGNIASGIEWYITQNFPLRIGFFTNFSNKPVIKEVENHKSNKINQQDHVDLYGGSFTFGYSTSDFTINLGCTFAYGRGKAQIIAGLYNTQDLDLFAFNLFISGGYQF